MQILRVTVRWSNFAGAPGYSAFHFSDGNDFFDGGLLGDGVVGEAQAAVDRVKLALNKLYTVLPDGVVASIQSEVEVLDPATGLIVGFVPVEGDTALEGEGGAAYSAASGAVVNWRTNDVRFGRRIRGRTFIVPLASSVYDAQGSLSDMAITAVLGFGTTLRNGDGNLELGVWSRPRDGDGGVFATVTSHSVPDMAAVLRSRRD